MPTQITAEQRLAEAIPDYVEPLMVFDDEATGRRVLRAIWPKPGTNGPAGRDWLFWKHPDGQWVSWRLTTQRDIAALDKAIESGSCADGSDARRGRL